VTNRDEEFFALVESTVLNLVSIASVMQASDSSHEDIQGVLEMAMYLRGHVGLSS
jgi:hypothetical protein